MLTVRVIYEKLLDLQWENYDFEEKVLIQTVGKIFRFEKSV